MTTRTIRFGTRGSELALTQTNRIADALREAHPGLVVEVQVIKTQGDRDQNSALNKFAGKGIFTKEIEDALLAGQIDMAVHSLKDLPTELPPGLALAAVPARADARDLLVSGCSVEELPPGALVGTGSARRREQLCLLRPDLTFGEIRGNVATRVQKWRSGLYQATVLACAGVARLGHEKAGLQPGDARPLELDQCVPAACQGLLGLEIRADDTRTKELLSPIGCPDAEVAATAERAFLSELGGGCHIPAGAHAEPLGEDRWRLTAFLMLGHDSGSPVHRRKVLEGTSDQVYELGRRAARELRSELSQS